MAAERISVEPAGATRVMRADIDDAVRYRRRRIDAGRLHREPERRPVACGIGVEIAADIAEKEHAIGISGRRIDLVVERHRNRPYLRAEMLIYREQLAVGRAYIDHAVRHRDRCGDVGPCAEAPELRAVQVVRIDGPVAGADIKRSVIDDRRAVNLTVDRIGMDDVTIRRIERIDVAVIRADIDDAVGIGRRTADGATGRAVP